MCGATTSGCIRATAIDLLQYGYPTLVPASASVTGRRDPTRPTCSTSRPSTPMSSPPKKPRPTSRAWPEVRRVGVVTMPKVRRFREILEELLRSTGASRTTLRLDLLDQDAGLDEVVAEALAPGVHSIRGDTSIRNLRDSSPIRFLEEQRTPARAGGLLDGGSCPATGAYRVLWREGADGRAPRARRWSDRCDLGPPRFGSPRLERPRPRRSSGSNRACITRALYLRRFAPGFTGSCV